MSEAGRRARAALPAVALLVLATGAMLALSTLLGFAPLPPAWRLLLTLLVALLLALAAADQVRAALTDWQGAAAAETGVHRRGRRRDPERSGEYTGEFTGEFTGEARRPERPKPRRPSWVRIAVTAAVAAVLGVLLWVPQLPVHAPARATATFLFGYAAYALPVLPLLLVWPLPRLPREPWPWQTLLVPVADRRRW
ncbi:hypothetical protein AB0M46_36705, partial [Dactylosporangium sp. NPDC051485]|uniref:hypothetical protein n=1 Tax=Dactylosporangium sp. NPDC051485 TaxID=3154846 RepID=UPI00343ADC3A